jgi:hypothetical protein
MQQHDNQQQRKIEQQQVSQQQQVASNSMDARAENLATAVDTRKNYSNRRADSSIRDNWNIRRRQQQGRQRR